MLRRAGGVTSTGALLTAVAQPEERARQLALSVAEPTEDCSRARDGGDGRGRAGSLVAAVELARRSELTPARRAQVAPAEKARGGEILLRGGDTELRREALLAAADADAEPGVEQRRFLQELSRVARAADDLRVAHALARRAAAEAAGDPRLRAEILGDAVNLTGYWGEGTRPLEPKPRRQSRSPRRAGTTSCTHGPWRQVRRSTQLGRGCDATRSRARSGWPIGPELPASRGRSRTSDASSQSSCANWKASESGSRRSARRPTSAATRGPAFRCSASHAGV